MVLFVLALVPRLVGLEQHLTADDREWLRDASRFSAAVRAGKLRETYQRIHPGITVLWLATLSFGPERSAQLVRESGDRARLVNVPTFVDAVFDVRRALAWTTAGLTVVLAYLVWRLLGTGPAVLAGLLLAGEPFLVAHDRLFHADPLLGHLMAVAVLAALLFFEGRGGWPALIGSGLAAGLALLTKAPAIFLFGFIPLLGVVQRVRVRPRPAGWFPTLAADLLLWGLAAGAIFVALWPALWVDLPGTLARFLADVRREGGTALQNGNFFLGAPIADPGPLFYPVATLLRLSPITLVGLLLLAGFGLRRLVGRRVADAGRSQILALVAYVALFTLMMTISPMKVDRYLLPAFPILVVLGALGLYQLLRRVPRLWAHRQAAIVGLGLAQAALVASVQPYPLSFFDPLLGGARWRAMWSSSVGGRELIRRRRI
jgi:4-amino-4-deoxy-L-arabinose transferase-like glycosyltransferase